MSNIQRVELVKPYRRYELPTEFVLSLVLLGFRVLFVWWAIAAWFPELGITYWQVILPVYAFRMLFTTPQFRGRPIVWKNLFRERWANIAGKEFEEVHETVTPEYKVASVDVDAK